MERLTISEIEQISGGEFVPGGSFFTEFTTPGGVPGLPSLSATARTSEAGVAAPGSFDPFNFSAFGFVIGSDGLFFADGTNFSTLS